MQSQNHSSCKPFHPTAILLASIVAGGCSFGVAGAGYGAYLHFHPEYKEELIRRTLSEPHMDNYGFLASAQAIRYMSFWEILARKAVWPALMGVFVGSIVGLAVADFKRRSAANRACDASRTLLRRDEHLAIVVWAFVLILMLFDVGSGSGMVYCEGHDQFYWCEQLEYGKELQRREAVQIACSLLQGRPFVCRSRMITALGKCGVDAAPAVPVLEKLSFDDETTVRKAAIQALSLLKGGSSSSMTAGDSADVGLPSSPIGD